MSSQLLLHLVITAQPAAAARVQQAAAEMPSLARWPRCGVGVWGPPALHGLSSCGGRLRRGRLGWKGRRLRSRPSVRCDRTPTQATILSTGQNHCSPLRVQMRRHSWGSNSSSADWGGCGWITTRQPSAFVVL
ncbi:hypothetical protein COO60DRAFT_1593291 [Scenedesmus sp. NREL 46B-D3]|nr:hypothetical protein COO60DRAFT_1593291 [Scenedesmus sp. NREL 46B-D3]